MLMEKLKNIVRVKERPHKIALAFSIGVFVGISPLIGIHTILGLALAWAFRLNRLVTLTGVYVTNPWSMVPIYTFCTWVGMLILGVDITPSAIDWKHLGLNTVLQQFRQILVPFAVGSTTVAVAAGFLVYFVTRKAVERAQEGNPGGGNPGAKEEG